MELKITVGFHAYATGVAVNLNIEIIISAYNFVKSGFYQPFLIGLTSSGKMNKSFGDDGISLIQLNDNANFATVLITKNEKIIAAYLQHSSAQEFYHIVFCINKLKLLLL